MSFPPDNQPPPGDQSFDPQQDDLDLTADQPEHDQPLPLLPVPGSPVIPARPAITTDRTVHLDDEAKGKLAFQVARLIDAYDMAVEQRRTNLWQWRRDYEQLPADNPGPWEHASALRAPMTALACDQHAQRLNNQIVAADPPFSVVAKRPEALQAAPIIEEVLSAYLDEARWKEIAREVHKYLPLAGNCLVRVTWEIEEQQVPVENVDWDQALFFQQLQAGISPTLAHAGAFKTDKQGQIKVTAGMETRRTFDGVKLAMITFEDLVVLPAGCRDIEHAYGIGERLVLRGRDLIVGAKAGKYDQTAVDELLEQHSDPDHGVGDERDEIEYEQGLDVDLGSEDDNRWHKEFVCYELCWLDDLDNDGKLEWYWLTLHKDTRKLLRCQYLPYSHGRACYVFFPYFKRPGELWAMSVAEKLATLQDGATAALNQIMDLADLMTVQAGNFFYDDTSGLNLDRFSWQPGLPQRVDSINGIKEMTFAPQLAAGIEAQLKTLEWLKTTGDLIAATSNPSLGRETDGQKTLGEVEIVMSQGNAIFEDTAAGVALCWAKVWDQVRWLLAQYSDSYQVQYRVSAQPSAIGPDGQPGATVMGQQVPAPGGVAFGVAPAHLLNAEVDLVPAGLNQFADAKSAFAQAQMILQTLTTYPLTQGNPQIMLIALDNWLQKIKFSRRQEVMGLVQQMLQQMQQQQEQQAQMQQMLMGAALQGDPQAMQMLQALSGGAPGGGGPAGSGGPGGSGGGPAGPQQDPTQQAMGLLKLAGQVQTLQLNDQKLGAGKMDKGAAVQEGGIGEQVARILGQMPQQGGGGAPGPMALPGQNGGRR